MGEIERAQQVMDVQPGHHEPLDYGQTAPDITFGSWTAGDHDEAPCVETAANAAMAPGRCVSTTCVLYSDLWSSVVLDGIRFQAAA